MRVEAPATLTMKKCGIDERKFLDAKWKIVMGIDGTFWYMEHVNQDLVT